jgi:hypothetical protein
MLVAQWLGNERHLLYNLLQLSDDMTISAWDTKHQSVATTTRVLTTTPIQISVTPTEVIRIIQCTIHARLAIIIVITPISTTNSAATRTIDMLTLTQPHGAKIALDHYDFRANPVAIYVRLDMTVPATTAV